MGTNARDLSVFKVCQPKPNTKSGIDGKNTEVNASTDSAPLILEHLHCYKYCKLSRSIPD